LRLFAIARLGWSISFLLASIAASVVAAVYTLWLHAVVMALYAALALLCCVGAYNRWKATMCPTHRRAGSALDTEAI
jgi:hypothetical protein